MHPVKNGGITLPLRYSYGLSVLHSHLIAGASLWLHSDSVLAGAFLSKLAASGCTSLAGVPHTFELLDSIGFADQLPATISVLTVAGGAMRPARVRHYSQKMEARGGRFFAMYGQTEATARIACVPAARVAASPDAIGVAIPGGSLRLRDAADRPVTELDAEGELVYRGPNVMMGYARDRNDLARGHEVEELAPGDLARRDRNGLYRITGRLSRRSKIAGLRIGHDALERALAAEGLDAAVWGDDRHIRIAVCASADGSPSRCQSGSGRIAARAAELTGVGVAHFEIHRVRALPRLANGKIDYRALGNLADPVPATADLLSAFHAAFAPRQVGPEDSFASLGGDSLRHVELMLAIEERLGDVPEGWERMPVRTLEAAQPAPCAGLPSDIVLRALAILAVVITHQTGWPVYGGAAAMILLMGASYGTFRWPALAAGDVGTFLAPLLRILVPYYLALAGHAIAWGEVPWISVALIGKLRHIGAAIEDVDFRTPRKLDRALFQQLATGRWIVDARNLMITGPCGVGKTWPACALGQRACRDNCTVIYQRLPRLFADLDLTHGDGRFPRLFRSLVKADLLILDDWGPERLTAGQRRDLMEIVEDRHDRGSILITCQLPVAAWHDVIGEPTFADAILDRLIHNAHRLELDGPSLRRSSDPTEDIDEGHHT